MVFSKNTQTLEFFTILSFCLFSLYALEETSNKVPFLDPDTIHNVTSQFQFNIILNENRNLPVFFVQYSKDFIRNSIESMIKSAFTKESGISFAIFVDCRNFQYNLNRTLNLCKGFNFERAKQQQKRDLLIEENKRQDNFFVFDLMAPDSSRIKQKGHELSKNHNIQNLRSVNTLFNDDYLVKVLRNQIADFVTYIEDAYDLDEFLEKKSQFRTSKKTKLLFFDQNLQAPLFLKKLAARLDGRIKVGVTDNFKLMNNYGKLDDSILLIQYSFITESYDLIKIPIQDGKQLQSILENKNIQRYMRIKKFRDMMLDFEHRQSPVYDMQSLSQLNQLMSYGRIIVLQISTNQNFHHCKQLQQVAAKYSVFLLYVCFSHQNQELLRQAGINLSTANNLYVIDKDFKSARSVPCHDCGKQFNIYEFLPRTPARQKVSAEGQAQLCLKTASASRRDPVLYWYNQKMHKNTLRLLEYFNSLPEVTSLIYFCQIYLPSDEVMEKFQLKQNSLFSMVNENPKTGEMQKIQFNQGLDFISIKMFLRQLSINQMFKVYHEKLESNSLLEIKSAQDLTRQCFNRDCIVALMATHKFRFKTETETLKQLQIQFSQTGYNFVQIDGHCHWDVAKQLKIIGKKDKEIDRSYIFYYKQKTNEYGLMSTIREDKYWVKKDVKKWIKSLKQSRKIKKIKFGIDIQDKKCNRKTQKNLQIDRKSARNQTSIKDLKRQQF